ncbi:LLM class flavin-dependent oxidoreductase [Mycobacterium sp. GA-0227b]|uniref:LLM class flavin-dependent oxidoreductase n=1 Tax=Mycobacterium sp. GA-0227b TaxID=1772274 RepID=UPI00156141C1|nr:LLM class flavin-dependent oxidoreductase [Mycobacterium sp. GA-0227b]
MKTGLTAWSMVNLEINAQAAAVYEQIGMDSVWVIDHLLGLSHPDVWNDLPASAVLADPDAFLDPFCTATAIAGRTSLPMGSAVIDITRRGSADLARALLTVHHAHPPGFILGVGAGIRLNLEPFGYEFKRRVSIFEQRLTEIRCLLDTGRMPNGVGRIGLPLESGIGRPQVWAAAHGPRMRRITGRLADGWITSGVTPEQYALDREHVLTVAAEAGRPRPTCAFGPLVFLGHSRESIAAALDEFPAAKLAALFLPAAAWQRHGLAHPTGPSAQGFADALPHQFDASMLRDLAPRIPFELWEKLVFAGNAEEVSARLRPYADAGCEHFILADATGLAMAPDQAAENLPHYGHVRALLAQAAPTTVS